MPEYIEREVAMEVIANVSFYLNPLCLKEQRKKIKAIPTADVAEVKHGKWIKDRNCYTCSECGFYYFANNSKANYCPNCGARMDEEENL